MQFKIKNTSIKISFSFLALVLLLFIADNTKKLVISLVCAFIHEFIHIIFIYLFSGKICLFSLSVFGANIKRKNTVTNILHEAIIAISAPIVNLLLFFLCFLFSYESTLFANINLVLGVVNILPFQSFDGGHFLENIMSLYLNEIKCKKILNTISVIVACIITVIAISLTVVSNKMHPLIILCVFMILSLVLKN